MDVLTKLARAFDTKGYPDDKDPNHWRTMNHTHVHIDANGNIDGGAGQKFNGKAWTSQKHPHNPASYPKPAAPPPPPAPPPVTTQDLQNQWKKVVKYMVATKQGKSAATKAKHAQNLLQAINDYTAMRNNASASVQATHKPKVQQALAFANNAIANPMGANVNHRPTAQAQAPTPQPAPNPPTPAPVQQPAPAQPFTAQLLRPVGTIAPGDLARLGVTVINARKALVADYCNKQNAMILAVEKAVQNPTPTNIQAVAKAYKEQEDAFDKAGHRSPATRNQLYNYRFNALTDGSMLYPIWGFAEECYRNNQHSARWQNSKQQILNSLNSPIQNLANATNPSQQAQTQPATNNLQSAPASGTVNKGRNIKIYNLSKRNVSALQNEARKLGLNPSKYSSTDALAKDVVKELNKRNQNYGSLTMAQVKNTSTSALMTQLMRVSASKLNPFMDNSKVAQRLCMALGMNEPPVVKSKADFDAYCKQHPNAPVFYRGNRPGGVFSAKDFADDLKYGDATWRGGSMCLYGQGIYNTTDYSEALSYGSGHKDGVVKSVLDMSKVKQITWQKLVSEGRSRGFSSGDDGALTVLAIQLGYNVIYKKHGNGSGDYYNVLDRSVLITQKETP